MGAADSKLSFKKGVFRLAEERHISADDPYWLQFWELPETAEDVFSLFSSADIRRTRDSALENIESLILALTSRLFSLRHSASFPDPDLAPDREALNCIRVLTRLLPYLYEVDSLGSWEEKFFWGVRRRRTTSATLNRTEVLFDEAGGDNQKPDSPTANYESLKPLAEELLDTLVDLLFYAGFTVPAGSYAPRAKVTYAIWQSGVGCNTPMASTKEHENNRLEILRLMLTMSSKAMYMPSNVLSMTGTKTLTYLVTSAEKKVVLSVLCSLLNTTLKYNPATWRVPYDHVVFSDPRQNLVTYSLHLLLVLLLYPVPEGPPGETPLKNNYRHYLGRLHRTQDFQFLVDGMTRVLDQPIQASTSYLPGSQRSLKWAPEMIMLFWESLQCNKRFRSFLIETNRAHDVVIPLIYYSLEYRTDAAKAGVVRMCVFVLQTLSSEPKFGMSLNKRFEAQNLLPANVRIPSFHGSYADYLIISIYNLITTSKGKLGAVYPAILAIVANIAPHVQGLSALSSSKLLQLFVSMSSPSFLLVNETNHTLLSSLLEAMNSIIEHQYSNNLNFIYSILKSHKRFESLRTFTLESGQEEIENQRRLQKDAGSDVLEPDSPRILKRPSLDEPPTPKTPSHHVPDPDAFAIGDSDDEDQEEGDSAPKPTASSAASIASTTPSRSASIDESLPIQLRGMSEKARGKLPMHSLSRQNSVLSITSPTTASMTGPQGLFLPTSTWIETWLPHLPLHTILTLIQEFAPQLKAITSRASAQIGPNGERPESVSILEKIRTTEIRGIDPSHVRSFTFEWSPMALGWYESLLWGFIYVSEMHVGKGTVGVWNGTAVKLFKVQETAAEGPSFLAPRGAVDAVASNLIDRLGNVNLSNLGRGNSNRQSENQAPSVQPVV